MQSISDFQGCGKTSGDCDSGYCQKVFEGMLGCHFKHLL